MCFHFKTHTHTHEWREGKILRIFATLWNIFLVQLASSRKIHIQTLLTLFRYAKLMDCKTHFSFFSEDSVCHFFTIHSQCRLFIGLLKNIVVEIEVPRWIFPMLSIIAYGSGNWIFLPSEVTSTMSLRVLIVNRLCKKIETGEEFAVKVVSKATLSKGRRYNRRKNLEEQLVRNIFKEYELVQNLNHPNIIKCYEVFETFHVLYIGKN